MFAKLDKLPWFDLIIRVKILFDFYKVFAVKRVEKNRISNGFFVVIVRDTAKT